MLEIENEVWLAAEANLLCQKDGLYMLVLLASSRLRWCPSEYLLFPCGFRFCMKAANIRQDTSTTWEKLINPRAHLFDKVSMPSTVTVTVVMLMQ